MPLLAVSIPRLLCDQRLSAQRFRLEWLGTYAETRPVITSIAYHAVVRDGAQEANEPAPGTDDYWRICTPYPFDLWLPARDAARAFELRIDELESFAYFSPGAQLSRHCPCVTVSNVQLP